jgi:hypothetical protein
MQSMLTNGKHSSFLFDQVKYVDISCIALSAEDKLLQKEGEFEVQRFYLQIFFQSEASTIKLFTVVIDAVVL